MQKSDSALRKRQQITSANRTMFLWVAGVSAIVGIAIVLAVFLFQRLTFNEKVLSKKQTTVSTLEANNEVVDELEKNIRLLNTDQALLDSRASPDDKPLQVILDALPSDANSSALGSSLQNVLLPGPDITIDSLTVNPVGTESSDVATDGTMNFSFSVSVPAGRIDSLRELLRRLERSIRAIDVTALTVEMQGAKVSLSVTAKAFYEPAKTIKLKDETVKP
jgi:cell division protein FtsB